MPASPQYILVVEDDLPIASFLQTVLEREGYQAGVVDHGDQVLGSISARRPDLILLDWMLPGKDGLQLTREIRQLPTYLPIIMLTARDDDIDKVVGLEVGADDYITKPFKSRELVARVRAILRLANHHTGLAGARLVFGSLEIDPPGRAVKKCGQALNLTPKEYELLELMASNPGRVFERDTLLERVWGFQYAGETRTVDVHIQRLRQRIEDDPHQPRYLVTVRNIGYKFER
jgi:DNA-binding response OmpR family regulator